MSEIGENTQIKSNLTFVAKVIAIVASAIWGYSVVWNKIITIENDLIRMRHQLELNSEFRIKWPRGELGALPEDSEQNIRLEYLGKNIDKLDSFVDELRQERMP